MTEVGSTEPPRPVAVLDRKPLEIIPKPQNHTELDLESLEEQYKKGLTNEEIDNMPPGARNEVKKDLQASKTNKDAGVQKEEAPKPHFKFVLTRHATKADAEVALRALEDCDVVGIEAVEADAENRSLWQELASIPKDSPRALEILSKFKPREGGQRMANFSYALAQGLVGSGKTVILIDIPKDDPKSNLIKEVNNSHNEYVSALRQKKNISITLGSLRRFHDIFNEFNNERDAFVLKQLKEISAKFEGKKGFTVGVLQGQSHRFPSDQMRSEGYSVEQTIINEAETGSEGIGLADEIADKWKERLIQQKELHPEKSVSDILLKKYILLSSYGEENRSDQEMAHLDQVVEKMSEDQADLALSKQLKTGLMDKVKNFFRFRR